MVHLKHQGLDTAQVAMMVMVVMVHLKHQGLDTAQVVRSSKT